MAAEEDDHDGSRRHGSLTARKIRGRPRHGTELGSRQRRENADRSPRPGPARQPDPLPDQARHAPLLRANPYSEVTDPICRFPLPTLIYRLEALYLGDLLRIWVRTGATPPRGPLLDFQGPRGRSGHRCNCGVLRVPNPISLLEVSRESNAYTEKKTLPGSPDGVFRSFWVTPTNTLTRARIGLGSTDSCATAVHKKPFSTSILQGLAGVFATTTKISTDGGSRQAHAQTLLRTPPRPSYSSGPRDDRGPPTCR
ncbi:uncharacterized protein LOC113563422 [Ooceraea biroi]|uniref:uncharacterized protein LOC113563422 n=1 Tax=Ooceraea biroi TaxID=2015173 RepID=UPI000F07F610|nr:uncharacterized protein LOC113563422 [Ooceraea biroi]